MGDIASEGPGELRLADVLDLKAASGLQIDLLAARGRNLIVDASEVRRLGGQCLQVLLAADAAWRADGLSLQVTNPSDAFTQAVGLFGASLDGRPHKEQLA